MKSDNANPALQAEETSERRTFVVGFVLASILTIIAFALVAFQVVPPQAMLVGLTVLAAIQVAVHLRCFLHIDGKRSHRDDLLLICLTLIVLAIVIGGTIWILWDQHTRMME